MTLKPPDILKKGLDINFLLNLEGESTETSDQEIVMDSIKARENINGD